MIGSMRTVPVKYSSGPFWEGRDPFRLISIPNSFRGFGGDDRLMPAQPRSMAATSDYFFPVEALHNTFFAFGFSQHFSRLLIPSYCRLPLFSIMYKNPSLMCIIHNSY